MSAYCQVPGCITKQAPRRDTCHPGYCARHWRKVPEELRADYFRELTLFDQATVTTKRAIAGAVRSGGVKTRTLPGLSLYVDAGGQQ